MARHIKVGLNSGKKAARSGLAGRVLSRLPAYNGLGARVLASMAMLSADSVTVSTSACATLGVKAEPRNVFPEDALYKRMQMLR